MWSIILKTAFEHSKIPFALSLSKGGRDFGMLTKWGIHRCFIFDSYACRQNKGVHAAVNIGNLTSQFLANLYLDAVDHFIKEQLNVSPYLRYVDDLVIWAGTKTGCMRFANNCVNGLRASEARQRVSMALLQPDGFCKPVRNVFALLR